MSEGDVGQFAKIIHDILRCDFHKLDIRPLTHQFILWWKKSTKTRPYGECIEREMTRRNGSTHSERIPPEVVSECVPVLKSQCEDSPVRVVKTIRLPGYVLQRFFREFDSEKMIFYIRDVRGIMVSREPLKWIDFKNDKKLKEQSRILCDRLAHDKRHVDSLLGRFPRDILRVKYEHLAKYPMTTSHKMYRFIDKTMPLSVQSWLYKNTHSTHADGIMGTRRNASATAEKWQSYSKFGADARKRVMKECHDVLSMHGYRV